MNPYRVYLATAVKRGEEFFHIHTAYNTYCAVECPQLFLGRDRAWCALNHYLNDGTVRLQETSNTFGCDKDFSTVVYRASYIRRCTSCVENSVCVTRWPGAY